VVAKLAKPRGGVCRGAILGGTTGLSARLGYLITSATLRSLGLTSTIASAVT
jgi:hypothetical protein